MSADLRDECRTELAQILGCSQCGHPYSHRACGPTHAILAAEPERHRLIAPLLEERARAAQQLILDQLHNHRPTRTFNSPDYTGGYQHAIDVIRRIRHGDETGDTT